MKANEAPIKLYFPIDDALETYARKDSDEEIEYTRTDAFMKKAENFLEMLGYGFTIIDNITNANYDKEQLIEDFKRYINKE